MEKAIEIFKSKDGKTQVEVKFSEETVWLTQDQLASLFNQTKQNISLHINNCFKEKELSRKSTVKKSLTVRMEGKRQISRNLEYYNLDVIISVGYRVNSKRGTQFRIWATQCLKDYLLQGYAINIYKLRAKEEQLNELKQSIKLLENVVKKKELSSDEAIGLLKVVTEYSHALDLLDKYDHQKLSIPPAGKEKTVQLNYKEAIDQIKIWREAHKAGQLFGNEKDKSFRSSLETIYQTFARKELYPGIYLKAAHLLYFVVKNHSFSDGNKRIAAGLFVFFLDKNKKLFRSDGSKYIADNALVAITILIAESKPEEKEIMVKLIVNLMGS
jgi:prophage maintenance system killer protein